MKHSITAKVPFNPKKRAPLRDVKNSTVDRVIVDGSQKKDSDALTKVSLHTDEPTRPMRSRRIPVSAKPKYVDDSDDDHDDSDDSSVSHHVVASKKSKTGKGASTGTKKVKKEKTPNKNSVIQSETLFGRNTQVALLSSPFGSSDWRCDFAKDY